MNPDRMGKVLRDLRLQKNLTQRSLADDAGCSAAHISLIENSLRYPSMPMLAKMCQSLGVEPHNIMSLAS